MTDMKDSPYDPWADIYDAVYSYVRDDIPFYVEQALRSGGPVLEVGCGTGRVALALAEAGFHDVYHDTQGLTGRGLYIARAGRPNS